MLSCVSVSCVDHIHAKNACVCGVLFLLIQCVHEVRRPALTVTIRVRFSLVRYYGTEVVEEGQQDQRSSAKKQNITSARSAIFH